MGKIVVLSLAILCFKPVIKLFSGVCLSSALGKNEDINVHMVDGLVFESWSHSMLVFGHVPASMVFVFLMVSGYGTRSSCPYGTLNQSAPVYAMVVVVSDAQFHSPLTSSRSVERRFGLE